MNLTVESLSDLELFLDDPTEEFVTHLLNVIDEGIKSDTPKIEVFSVNFTKTAQDFKVFLPKDKWPNMINTLQQICEKKSFTDTAIDAYLLNKKYKEVYND